MLLENLVHIMIVLNIKICLEIKHWLLGSTLTNLSFKIFFLNLTNYIFDVCVGGDLEESFLKLDKTKNTLINTIHQFITSDDNFIGNYYVCEQCDIPCITPMVKALGCFCNICLNNSSRKNTDKMGKRTLTIFHFKVSFFKCNIIFLLCLPLDPFPSINCYVIYLYYCVLSCVLFMYERPNAHTAEFWNTHSRLSVSRWHWLETYYFLLNARSNCSIRWNNKTQLINCPHVYVQFTYVTSYSNF